ncbi:hypothetical protein MnTg02_02543 [bacterium MnTg02]|nr:hypothetical protein MnTg02_02543 [bacterium MnTg02]
MTTGLPSKRAPQFSNFVKDWIEMKPKNWRWISAAYEWRHRISFEVVPLTKDVQRMADRVKTILNKAASTAKPSPLTTPGKLEFNE